MGIGGWLVLTQLLAAPSLTVTWVTPCGPPPQFDGLPEGAAAVVITPMGSRWHTDVAFVLPTQGRRSLDVDTCEGAMNASVLLLKLGATAPPPPPRKPLLALEAPRPPAVRSAFELRPYLRGTGNLGSLPELSGRIGAGIGVLGARLAAFAEGRMGFAATFAGGPAGAHYRITPLVGGQLMGCWLEPLVRRVRLGGCAVGVVEALNVRGLDVANPRSVDVVGLALGADAHVMVEVFLGLFAFGQAGVRIALRRPSVFFDGWGTVFTAPLVGGEVSIGLGWKFEVLRNGT